MRGVRYKRKNISRVGKSTETKSTSVAARGLGAGKKREKLLNGYGVSL